MAVDLGFLTLETDIKRALDGLMRLKTDDRTNAFAGQTIMLDMQVIAKIASPPILERNVDRLFMLGGRGRPALPEPHPYALQARRAGGCQHELRGVNEPRPVANGGR